MYIYTLKGWYEMNRTYELLSQEHQLFLHVNEALACYKQAYQTFERSERITRVMSLWSLTLQERMDMKYFERQYAYMARDEAQRQIDLFRFANDLCIRDILEEIIICEEKIGILFPESNTLQHAYWAKKERKKKAQLKSKYRILSSFRDESLIAGFGSLNEISDTELVPKEALESDTSQDSGKIQIEPYLSKSFTGCIYRDRKKNAILAKQRHATLYHDVMKDLTPAKTRRIERQFIQIEKLYKKSSRRAAAAIRGYYKYKSLVYEAFVKFFTLYLQHKAVRQELDCLLTTQGYQTVAQQYLRLYF